jgi:dUTP pyrophosphatase
MINIFTNNKLKETLEKNNINVNDYVPAYNGESAGLDLFNVNEDVTIMPTSNMFPGQKTLISTGLHIIVPKGWVALVQERGSITKTPLKLRAGVIDSGYTGEVFVNLVNVSETEYKIKKNNKLPVQIVVVKCDNDYTIVSEDVYLELTSKSLRREGKVGSTD